MLWGFHQECHPLCAFPADARPRSVSVSRLSRWLQNQTPPRSELRIPHDSIVAVTSSAVMNDESGELDRMSCKNDCTEKASEIFQNALISGEISSEEVHMNFEGDLRVLGVPKGHKKTFDNFLLNPPNLKAPCDVSALSSTPDFEHQRAERLGPLSGEHTPLKITQEASSRFALSCTNGRPFRSIIRGADVEARKTRKCVKMGPGHQMKLKQDRKKVLDLLQCERRRARDTSDGHCQDRLSPETRGVKLPPTGRRYNDEITTLLLKVFEMCSEPDGVVVQAIAMTTKLTGCQVGQWFQNRRKRLRRQKKNK